MTASYAPNDLWRTMPGWGITANLLPPEIVTARRAKVMRKFVLSAVMLVVLLGVAGYFYAVSQKDDANSELAAATTQTAVLHAEQAKYSPVVTVSGQIQTIAGQLSQVLAPDVDMTALLGRITAARPAGTTVTELQATIVGLAGASSSAPDGAGVLDPSGHVHVGTISLTGTTHSLSNVAGYVVALDKIRGVVTAFPSAASTDEKGLVTYTIDVTLTDQVFSHKYDALAAGAGTTTQGGS